MRNEASLLANHLPTLVVDPNGVSIKKIMLFLGEFLETDTLVSTQCTPGKFGHKFYSNSFNMSKIVNYHGKH